MLSNADIRLIRSLASPHGMRRHRLFVAEGQKLVRTLLAGELPCAHLLTTDGQLADALRPARAEVVSAQTMERLSGLKTPSPVLGVFSIPRHAPQPLDSGLTVALEGVQDPGNVGTIVRTANWFGARQLLCSPGTASAFSPKAIQASMGAIGALPVVYGDLPELLAQARGKTPIVASTLEGRPLRERPLPREGILLVGSEGHGLSRGLLELASERVYIPPIGIPEADSLNVATATGILLASMRGAI